MISFKKKTDIEKEIDVLSNAYQYMDTTEKLIFISCLCSFKTYEIVSKMYRDICTLRNL